MRSPRATYSHPLNLQAFVFNWRGYEPNALALERAIGRWAPVTVINSDEGAAGRRPHWVHLGESAYFSAQWNKALELFDGDVLFHVQADVNSDDFGRLLARARFVLGRGDVGVYEPEAEATFPYEASRLRAIAPQLFEVPLTDSTCWFIAADVLRGFPPVDVSINRYGWGIAAAVAATCRLNGGLCARDYGFKVAHAPGRGYPGDVARRERDAYLDSLGQIGAEAARLYEWRSRVKPGGRPPRRRLRRLLGRRQLS